VDFEFVILRHAFETTTTLFKPNGHPFRTSDDSFVDRVEKIYQVRGAVLASRGVGENQAAAGIVMAELFKKDGMDHGHAERIRQLFWDQMVAGKFDAMEAWYCALTQVNHLRRFLVDCAATRMKHT
jgi:hypothetical protein